MQNSFECEMVKFYVSNCEVYGSPADKAGAELHDDERHSLGSLFKLNCRQKHPDPPIIRQVRMWFRVGLRICVSAKLAHSRLYQNFPKASIVFCISVCAFSAMAA